MNNALLPVIGGLAGVIITAVLTSLKDRREKSGDVEASSAKVLWNSMSGELVRLQTEATTLRTEMAAARIEMTIAREEMANLRMEAALFRQKQIDLEEELKSCHEVNTKLLANAGLYKGGKLHG